MCCPLLCSRRGGEVVVCCLLSVVTVFTLGVGSTAYRTSHVGTERYGIEAQTMWLASGWSNRHCLRLRLRLRHLPSRTTIGDHTVRERLAPAQPYSLACGR